MEKVIKYIDVKLKTETLKDSRSGEIRDLPVIDTIRCRACITAPRKRTQRLPGDSYAGRRYRHHFDILHSGIGGPRKRLNHIRFATPSTRSNIVSGL